MTTLKLHVVWLPEAQNGPMVEVEYIRSFFLQIIVGGLGGWTPSSWEVFYVRETLLVPNRNMQKNV